MLGCVCSLAPIGGYVHVGSDVVQCEGREEYVARRISVRAGTATDFRAPASKERGVCVLGEKPRKCMLARGERCIRRLRQGEVNSQSRAGFELVF